MSKLLLFFGLTWLFGNPFLAIIVLLILFYLLERRFVGLSPSLLGPLRRRNTIVKRQRQLLLSPHNVSAKSELARLLIESKRFNQAREILLEIQPQMEHSAEYWSDLGLCDLAQGKLEAGEKKMEQAVKINPRVKYGQPFLKLAEAYAKSDPAKAVDYLQQFKGMNSSSCEAYYRLGTIYTSLEKGEDAAKAYEECRVLYRALPRYLKRHERKWMLLSRLRNRG